MSEAGYIEKKKMTEAHLDGSLLARTLWSTRKKNKQHDKQRIKKEKKVAECFAMLSEKKPFTFVVSKIQGADAWCPEASEGERHHLLQMGWN